MKYILHRFHAGRCFVLLSGFGLLALSLIAARGTYGSEESPSSSAKEWSYLGSKKCKLCHLKQHKSWKGTLMSQSFDLLKPGVRTEAKQKAGIDPDKDYTTDKTCLPCHTTGYGKPGGFVSIEETPELAGVGCEVCHGAAEGYLRKGYMTMKNKRFKKADLEAAGLVLPDSSTCTDLCHNEKNPFNKPFNWEERKTKGTHKHLPLKYDHS